MCCGLCPGLEMQVAEMAFKVPHTGRAPSSLAEVEELSGQPRERADCGALLAIPSPLKSS